MDDVRQAAKGFERIAGWLRTSSWRASGPRNLSPTQKRIVSLLSARGPLGVGALAQELGVRQPTASDAVTTLERKGLVIRMADPADRRASLVRLTRSGRAAARAEDGPDALFRALDGLPGEERAVLMRVLSGVIRQLQLDGEISVQRMCVTCRHFRPNAHDNPAAPHHCKFVNAAFGDASLRVDCGDHEQAADNLANANWMALAGDGAA